MWGRRACEREAALVPEGVNSRSSWALLTTGACLKFNGVFEAVNNPCYFLGSSGAPSPFDPTLSPCGSLLGWAALSVPLLAGRALSHSCVGFAAS